MWAQFLRKKPCFQFKRLYSNNHDVAQISYVKSVPSMDLCEDTIGVYWKKQVVKYKEKELLYSHQHKQRFSWFDLDSMANAFAKGLLKLGFEKGDRLGVWLPNCPEWLVCQIATAKLGVITVNVNPGYRTSELEHSIKQVGIKAIILAPEVKSSNYISIMNQFIPDLSKFGLNPINSDKVPSLKYVINTGNSNFPGMHNFYNLLIETHQDMTDSSVHNSDAVNIQFTSGTTGLPKGATLSHRNILNNGIFVGEFQNLNENDVVCVPVPLYHCFGCVMGNLAAITHGAKLVYPSEVFDATKVLETIEPEKCTALYGVPTMFIAELNHPNFKKVNFSTLRTGIMAGSPCPMEVMQRVINEMNCKEVTIAYGMTETSPVSFQTTTSHPLRARVESVGTIHDHLEAKIVDPDGNITPRGTPGELCIKGYSVMKGYWNDEKKTNDVLDKDGWMHTGDMAEIDDSGFCRIVGRIKDMIIRGGENIYPRELEEFLYSHPSIKDVQVVGVPDEKYGEEVCAFVILKDSTTLTEKELKEYCKEKIAHYKIPKYVKFADSFPMTVTGKVQKHILREQFKKQHM